jgi:hypothetical protein
MYHPLSAQASNIKMRENPLYTLNDFLTFYPQFAGLLPDVVLSSFLELGQACVSKQRFGKMWQLSIGLFIAHFCTLYLQNAAEPGTEAADVLNAAQAAGVVTSESADGVSYSMDTSTLSQDLAGWAAFKMTAFGSQFATIAKLVGKGGMYIW